MDVVINTGINQYIKDFPTQHGTNVFAMNTTVAAVPCRCSVQQVFRAVGPETGQSHGICSRQCTRPPPSCLFSPPVYVIIRTTP